MNIAILTEFSFNEGHIERLSQLGRLAIYGNTLSEPTEYTADERCGDRNCRGSSASE